MGAKRVSKQGVTVSQGNAIEVTDTAGSVLFSVDNAGSVNTLANLTTTGDIIYASAASTPARLGIGSTDQVLTVSGGVPAWATPAGGGKVLQVVSAVATSQTSIASTTYTDTGLSASITPSSTSSKVLVLISQSMYLERSSGDNRAGMRLMRGATEIFDMNSVSNTAGFGNSITLSTGSVTYVAFNCYVPVTYLDSPNTTSSTTYKLQLKLATTANSAQFIGQWDGAESSIVLLEIGA